MCSTSRDEYKLSPQNMFTATLSACGIQKINLNNGCFDDKLNCIGNFSFDNGLLS